MKVKSTDSRPTPAKPTVRKGRPGRPSDYTESIGKKVCELIAGGSSLRDIAALPNMPSKTAVIRWARQHDGFRDQYARARQDQATAKFDQISDLVKDMLDGGIPADIARVAIDACKWQASKLEPKKYGDKLDVEHSGAITVKRTDFSKA